MPDPDVVSALDAQEQARTQRRDAEAERAANRKPTPSQREIDLARLGALDPLEPKEDHGAEPEAELIARQAEEQAAQARAFAEGQQAGYQTRGIGEQRRGPGRPRKEV